ncbi:MAG TPA: aldose 1-epimerase family protein [Anaerolineae bacterium]|nr:aldose 1-epimerase family protein [Anaerolineae bacterium]
MATLFGKRYTREGLLRYVGDVSQIGGVQLKTLDNGPARGVRTADFYTGSGFRFTVLIDRGMDIGPAEWGGRPLAWRSPVGVVHPAYYDPLGLGWLRSFAGGLMVGCGLDNVGLPCTDAGEELGLHGRLSHIPAELISCSGAWHGDEYEMWVEGEVRHYKVFGADLVLRRRISTTLGSDVVSIADTIANAGTESAPLQILYHCNFGYPVVSADTELKLDTEHSEPRDETAALGFGEHTRFQPPTAGYAEQVFYHHPRAGEGGYAVAALVNGALHFGAYVRFRTAELPHLVQWKMMGERTYVVGLEPANCWVQGRAHDRQTGALQFLAPGERVSTHLQIGALPDQAAIDAMAANWTQPSES